MAGQNPAPTSQASAPACLLHPTTFHSFSACSSPLFSIPLSQTHMLNSSGGGTAAGVGSTRSSPECGGLVNLCARVGAATDAGKEVGADRLLPTAFDSRLGAFSMVTGLPHELRGARNPAPPMLHLGYEGRDPAERGRRADDDEPPTARSRPTSPAQADVGR